MWKYELEYRIDKPETEGETDKHFDLYNYKDWLEEQLTNCRKQLSIPAVSVSVCYNRDCFYYDKTDNTCVGNYKACTVKQTGR